MTKQQRAVFFVLGLVLGCLVVGHLLKGRAAKKAEADALDNRRVIPGQLLDWAKEGRAIYNDSGKGVFAAALGPGAEGFARTRRVLFDGRRRFDAMNRPEPVPYLVATEYYAEAGPLTPATPVKRVDFAYADRLRVVVREPAHTGAVYQKIKDLGGHLHPEPGSRTVVTAKFEPVTLETTGRALERLRGMPEVVSAEIVPIDWTKEISR